LRKHFGADFVPPPEWERFLSVVDASYGAADEDRALLERSMEISSQELVDRNASLKGREAELKDAYERLKTVDAQRVQFFNNAAHELGTPLTPILIQLHMLRAELDGAEGSQARKLDVVERNMKRLQNLARDILDAAKLQGARIELRTEAVDVGAAAYEAIEGFQGLAAEKGVRLGLSADGSFVALADRHRVDQVLYNLLSNALKFTPAGGDVQVSLQACGRTVQVEVRDTGRGIPEDGMGRLFQPFSQVHETTPGTEGTGLGLYVSRGIVEAMGGSMGCESEGTGRGSCFHFDLPARHADAGSAEAAI